MTLIVFAVVLGFAVTNWNASRNDRHRAAVALDRITSELERNSASLADAAPYYSKMSERLDSILDTRGEVARRDIVIPGWRGLRPPPIRRASFQVAMETGALEHIDFALVDRIALAYDITNEFSASIDNALSTFIAGDLIFVSEWQIVFALLSELAGIAQTHTEDVLILLRAE